MKRIFVNNLGKLRNAWWVAVFFLILSVFVFPMVILSQEYHFEISFWHQVIVIALTSIICQRLSGISIASLVGKFSWRDLFIGMIMGGLLMLVPAVILTTFGLVHWSIGEGLSANLLSAMWFMLGVVLAEELLFRGFIFQRLIAGIGEWPAQILIALLFLLTHASNLDIPGPTRFLAMINIFTASILFGMAYLKTKSLVVPIAIHFSANIMQGSILGFGVSGNEEISVLSPELIGSHEFFTGGQFGLEAGFVGLLTLFTITIGFYFRHARKFETPPPLKS